MSHPHALRFYGYVDRPYEAVRVLLRDRATDVLQHATTTAGARADALVAPLHARLSGFELGVDVKIEVAKELDDEGAAGLPPVSHFAINWRASRHASLFPSMSGHLSLSPMAFAETRVEFDGSYRPPFGLAGDIFNEAMGHRIAEAAVHGFVNDVIAQIRRELPGA